MITPRPDKLPHEKSIFMIVKENNILQSAGSEPLPYLTPEEVEPLWSCASYHAKIGEYHGSEVYLLIIEDLQHFDDFETTPLRQLLGRVDTMLFAIAGRAIQVAYFIRTHNFCSRCGSSLQEVTDELAVYCGPCDYRTYPRISPCIIVAVYRGVGAEAEILLARGAHHREGLFSVLAGFVESGETLEQTVQREVWEETQVLVDDVEYVTSQAWPFPHSLMAGFVARYASGELKVDEVELIEGGWFKFNELPTTPPPGTIAAMLIEQARKHVNT